MVAPSIAGVGVRNLFIDWVRRQESGIRGARNQGPEQVAICRIQLRRCEGGWCRRKPREYAKFGKGAKIRFSYVAAECDSSQPRATRRIWGDPVLVRHIFSRLGTTASTAVGLAKFHGPRNHSG